MAATVDDVMRRATAPNRLGTRALAALATVLVGGVWAVAATVAFLDLGPSSAWLGVACVAAGLASVVGVWLACPAPSAPQATEPLSDR
jgi:cation transporter-like permease